jgi:hypothetical protein
MERVAVVVTVVAGDVEEVDISEDSRERIVDFLVDISEAPLDVDFPVDFLVVEDFPVDLLVSVEDLLVEDIVNTHHIAAREAIVLEDITVATVQEDIMELATVDTVEAGLEDIPMADTTMSADITEVILGITIEDGPPMEQPLDFSTVG